MSEGNGVVSVFCFFIDGSSGGGSAALRRRTFGTIHGMILIDGFRFWIIGLPGLAQDGWLASVSGEVGGYPWVYTGGAVVDHRG